MAFIDVVAADFTENRPGNEDTMGALAQNAIDGLSDDFTLLNPASSPWSVPSGWEWAEVIVLGAGGGGGGGGSASGAGNGGNSGVIRTFYLDLVLGSYTYSVGTGGAGGVGAGGHGSTGGTSTFGPVSSDGGLSGKTSGFTNHQQYAGFLLEGGIRGVSSTTREALLHGLAGLAGSGDGGGGGGAAGCSFLMSSGQSNLGYGGDGGDENNNGSDAGNYGGGGGGAGNIVGSTTGGDGADGCILIRRVV